MKEENQGITHSCEKNVGVCTSSSFHEQESFHALQAKPADFSRFTTTFWYSAENWFLDKEVWKFFCLIFWWDDNAKNSKQWNLDLAKLIAKLFLKSVEPKCHSFGSMQPILQLAATKNLCLQCPCSFLALALSLQGARVARSSPRNYPSLAVWTGGPQLQQLSCSLKTCCQ